MFEGLKYAGKLTLTLRDENGNIKDKRVVDNTIVSGGLDWLIKTTMNNELTAMTVFSVGSTASGGAANIQDGTGTITEAVRKAFTYTTGATVGGCSATATWESSGAGGETTTGITEAAIHNGTTTTGDGVLFARAMFAAVNKAAGDSLEVKWDITYS